MMTARHLYQTEWWRAITEEYIVLTQGIISLHAELKKWSWIQFCAFYQSQYELSEKVRRPVISYLCEQFVEWVKHEPKICCNVNQ